MTHGKPVCVSFTANIKQNCWLTIFFFSKTHDITYLPVTNRYQFLCWGYYNPNSDHEVVTVFFRYLVLKNFNVNPSMQAIAKQTIRATGEILRALLDRIGPFDTLYDSALIPPQRLMNRRIFFLTLTTQ